MTLTHFDDNAQHIAGRQYLQPGDGDISGMFRRIATWVAGAEEPGARPHWAQAYYDLMAEKKFCPGGRVLAGAGTQHGNVLNCFVQGATEHAPHTFDGVMEVAKKLALVTKVGGGNGVNLDVYTPRAEHSRPDTGVRGWAYMSAAHADVQDFIEGLMRPPTQPDGEKQPISVRNWTRVVYGQTIKPELMALARANGVGIVTTLPQGVHTSPERFGVHTVPDDMGGIIDVARQIAQEAAAGRPPRLDLSSMRPEGAPIKGSGGTSSGPVSFLLEIFDNFLEWANRGAEQSGPINTLRFVYAPVLRVVRQGGTRRGAGMATISIEHPDVLDFLTAKDLDREAAEGDISTFNISILVSSAFWDTLQAGGLWPVNVQGVPGKYYLAPQDTWTGAAPTLPTRAEDDAQGVPVYTDQDGQISVPAQWLWDQIAQHAWSTGEPGLIFVDRINEYSALKNLGPKYQIRSTNPCFRRDTLIVHLQDGQPTANTVQELAEDFGEVHVWDGVQFTPTTFRITGRDQDVFTVTVASGETVTATAAHTFILESGQRLPLADLRPGMRLKAGAPETGAPGANPHFTMQRQVPMDFTVTSVEPAGTEREVYCCTVPGEHALTLANGILTGNCGEIPLTVGEPCDLGAINLAAYVQNSTFDYATFRADVRTAVRFLDDVLDVNVFALEDNRVASSELRRLGLGVMGLADALIKLGLRYDSEAGRDAIYDIMSALREEAVAESERLGEERGTYPLYAQVMSGHADPDAYHPIPHAPRRNVAVLTVAPTGTTSMLMGVSSGIEPIFSPFIWRKIGSEYRALLAPLFVELLETYPAPQGMTKDGGWDWDKVTEAVSENHGSVVGLPFIPDALQQVFVCAHDIKPADHVRMQGTVQRAFDAEGHAANSLSKTINLPNDATVQDVQDAYSEAYRTGCKGITVYRDGSRQFQVLSTSKKKAKTEDGGAEPTPAPSASADVMGEQVSSEPLTVTPQPAASRARYERPTRLRGVTDMVKLTDPTSGHRRSFLVTVNELGGNPVEVMVISGRAGDEANADSEALGRIVSIALQHGVPVQAIIKTLRGINGGLYGSYNGRLVGSKADLIAVALETFQKDQSAAQLPPLAGGSTDTAQPITTSAAPSGVSVEGMARERCPVCEEKAVIREEGCLKCQACGYSKCG